ncbi:ATP-binding cassette domain-containing protein [Klebsiella pneumoniae]|uniref:ATP-binding cassette domain-containing protein n=1 Tax=Klebsiella pneumoniae TaxID=573 RepID=A0A923J8B8_KLEPN|nr:ATP-binding cassette domain-containing protein [Klebsiella pneumoniae]
MNTTAAAIFYAGGFFRPPGEVTCLLGRNGVGKTTLLKCLMGLIPARSGEVRWQDQNITHRKPHQRVQAGVAYVPGARDISAPDGGRKPADGAVALSRPRSAAGAGGDLPAFPVLRTMKQRRGGDLSGGQQQQLAIGRALASRPQLLILMNPPRDPALGHQEIGEVIRQLASRGDMAILLVEQFYDFAAGLADHYSDVARRHRPARQG